MIFKSNKFNLKKILILIFLLFLNNYAASAFDIIQEYYEDKCCGTETYRSANTWLGKWLQYSEPDHIDPNIVVDDFAVLFAHIATLTTAKPSATFSNLKFSNLMWNIAQSLIGNLRYNEVAIPFCLHNDNNKWGYSHTSNTTMQEEEFRKLLHETGIIEDKDVKVHNAHEIRLYSEVKKVLEKLLLSEKLRSRVYELTNVDDILEKFNIAYYITNSIVNLINGESKEEFQKAICLKSPKKMSEIISTSVTTTKEPDKPDINGIMEATVTVWILLFFTSVYILLI